MVPVKYFRGGFLKAHWPNCSVRLLRTWASSISPTVLCSAKRQHMCIESRRKTHVTVSLIMFSWQIGNARLMHVIFFVDMFCLHLQIQSMLFDILHTQAYVFLIAGRVGQMYTKVKYMVSFYEIVHPSIHLQYPLLPEFRVTGQNWLIRWILTS